MQQLETLTEKQKAKLAAFRKQQSIGSSSGLLKMANKTEQQQDAYIADLLSGFYTQCEIAQLHYGLNLGQKFDKRFTQKVKENLGKIRYVGIEAKKIMKEEHIKLEDIERKIQEKQKDEKRKKEKEEQEAKERERRNNEWREKRKDMTYWQILLSCLDFGGSSKGTDQEKPNPEPKYLTRMELYKARMMGMSSESLTEASDRK